MAKIAWVVAAALLLLMLLGMAFSSDSNWWFRAAIFTVLFPLFFAYEYWRRKRDN